MKKVKSKRYLGFNGYIVLHNGEPLGLDGNTFQVHKTKKDVIPFMNMLIEVKAFRMTKKELKLKKVFFFYE